ncbi:uncharacterized protein LOC111295520 [Durio zibethinus]|uniref:Uncharacterized protein LOC111295520 n=1 Tax=Durio zibethinus TaxID=66656 RepID=A0A6P5YW65_DURZI|nr:uncharacterized protein LOC111295520 [Durio zibethinus]
MFWLSLKRSKELGLFWASLPCFLVKLSLESCRLSAYVIPNDLSSSLANLDEILLTSCSELQLIPKLPIFSPLIEIYVALSPLALGLSSLPCLMSFKRCIIFGCEKLTEVEGVFKLEPTENFQVEQIKNTFNNDSIDSNKVQLFNYLTDTKIVATLQVLHECGITSTFIPGSEVPIGFEHHSKGPQIAFSLPTTSHPCEKISCFNLCIVFSLVSDQIFESLPCVYIINKTKGVMRAYYSNFFGIPETNNNTLLWLIHWPAMGFSWKVAIL